MSPTSREQRWFEALALPGHADLQQSLVAELAAYLGIPTHEVGRRCDFAMADLASAWNDASPRSPAEIDEFYRHADTYLYDLTRWHALVGGKTALVQVEALEWAEACRAKRVLDFGCGIGSLGLLYARQAMTVTLADVNRQLLDYARWRFERRQLSVRRLDLTMDTLPDKAFEFISAIDVLEHLPDPFATVQRLSAALAPGGTLFINFPIDPDGAHPMHLWRDHSPILSRLAESRLELIRIDGDTLVLKRSERMWPRRVLAYGCRAGSRIGSVKWARRG